MKLLRRQIASITAGLILIVSGADLLAEDAVRALPRGNAQITVRKDGAVVRERVEVDLTGSRTRIQLPGIPPEADPSSFIIKDKYGTVKLVEWSVPSFQKYNEINAAAVGRGVRIDFEKADALEQETFEAVLDSRIPGRRSFDVIYAITGMTWSASYDVLLRGELEEVGKRLSMDAQGWIEIKNQTRRTYTNALVSVIGSDTLGEKDIAVKEPGILELDEDSPLADLWRDKPPEVKTPRVYPLSEKVTIPSVGSVMISHVSVKRKPVQRVLLLRAEEIPTDTFTRFAKPSQIITFQNEADYGGNQSVPPGPALIHVGNQRSSVYQKAWFKHTAANGEIRIDMGKIDGIRSRRINRGRAEIAGGGYEQIFEVRIENLLDHKINIVVDEEPPVYNLAWTIVRANRPYEPIGRRLVFSTNVKAASETIIQYTVRYSLPER